MHNIPKADQTDKQELHPRNLHRSGYDFSNLVEVCPDLAPFVKDNEYGNSSIDFFNPTAVLLLNQALLLKHYSLDYWGIPDGYLCPPIPGRADYIHHLADLLAASSGDGKIPEGKKIRCLDVGVGANAIYPIIGSQIYGWSFVGSDIDQGALENVKKIVASTEALQAQIITRLQPESKHIFKNIIQAEDRFALTICNPPFHASAEEARLGNLRKLSNLSGELQTDVKLNFGGQGHELWYPGGEVRFLKTMIQESKWYAKNCLWFSSLISKQENIREAKKALKKAGAVEHRIIRMGQGNKISRVVVWTYFEAAGRNEFLAESI